MKKKFELPYALKESLRLTGLRPFIKWGTFLALVAYFLWPAPEAPQSQIVPIQVSQADPHAPLATRTESDLREIMTAEQTAFYWKSFEWMMQYGAVLKPKSLDGRVVFVSYLKDESFKAENGLKCHPFSEKLIVAGKFNLRRGVGCEKSAGNWCRQIEGEQAHCRTAAATGFAADSALTLQNMRLDWDRNLNNFGL